MPLLVSLGEIRDVVIIVWGIMGAIFFLVGLIVVIVLGSMARRLLKTVRELLDDNVKPALGSVKEAADTVRGTTEFVGRTAVSPVVKAYSTAAGIKRGLSVFGRIRGRSA